MFDTHDLIGRLIGWILLVVSLSVHEWAHAWSAWQLGDDTAEREGRLTFNPMVHIDPIGTVLLPLLGVPFGWARPVPVNPANFRKKYSPAFGMMLTAIAGPISNLVQAVSGTFVYALLIKFEMIDNDLGDSFSKVVLMYIVMNIVLAVFNMIPVPPLDGSRVADFFMPRSLRPAWESFQSVGPLVLMALILLPQLLNVSLIERPVIWMLVTLMDFVSWLVGV
jgi:Zn-dependent protease